MTRVGILGGTFDPIHLGHLAAAEAALRCAGLDRVVLIPAAEPPHKGAPHASPEDRLAMAQVAVRGHPRFSVSDLELARGGPSYTVDTLVEFKRTEPGSEPELILGWDAAREIRSWHDHEEVLRLAPIVLLSRPTLPVPTAQDLVAAGLDRRQVTVCEDRTPDIRATEIRKLAGRGSSLAELVPAVVERYIRERGLYGAPRAV